MKHLLFLLLLTGLSLGANALPIIEDSVRIKAKSLESCADANRKLAEKVRAKIEDLGMRFLGGKIDKKCIFFDTSWLPKSIIEEDHYTQSMTIRFRVDSVLGHFHQEN